MPKPSLPKPEYRDGLGSALFVAFLILAFALV